MKRWLAWLVMGLFAVLGGACGGGGEPDAPPIPARAGAADIGPAGGRIDAVLEGGTTVTLEVPPGAVTAVTSFRIEPVAPSAPRRLGEFLLTTNLQLALHPLILTVTVAQGPSITQDTSLALVSAQQVIPMGSAPDALRRVVAVLSALPPSEAQAAARLSAGRTREARSAAAGQAQEQRVRISLEEAIPAAQRANAFLGAVVDLAQQASIDNAVVTVLAAEGTVLNPNVTFNGRPVIDIWRETVCAERSHAVSALDTFDGVDVATFRSLAFDAAVWTLLAIDMNRTLIDQGQIGVLGCGLMPDDFRQPVIDKLPDFIARLSHSLDLIDARTDYAQLLDDRMPELIELESFMQFMDLGRSVLDLIEAQMNRLRRAGFDACHDAGDQDLQRRLLVAKVGNAAFTAVMPFGEADLRSDIQSCGMRLDWELSNELGQVVGSALAGGVAFGDLRASANLAAAGTTRLVLHGPLRALACSRTEADGKVSRFANNEQLVVRVGPAVGNTTEVARLTPSNEQQYLQITPLEFDLANLRSVAAAIQPTGAIRVDVARSGDFCGGTLPNFTAHAVIASLVLDFQGLVITTASLSAAKVGVAYFAQFSASGGSEPYTWSATGLPDGLNIDAASGALHGTPATAGLATLNVTVRSADGLTASTPATVKITNVSSGIFGGAGNMILDVALPSGAVNCPETHVDPFVEFPANPLPQSASLSCSGQNGESAAATVSFATTFAGSHLVALTASGTSLASAAEEFHRPSAASSFMLRFTATRVVQLVLDVELTFVGNANLSVGLILGRDNVEVVSFGGGSISQTLTLLPGAYTLIIHGQGEAPVSTAFNLQLAFGP